MESSKNLRTLRSTLRSKEAPAASSYILQSECEAQTARLQDIYKAQRPKNTTRSYEPKQKEWENWCARLKGNTDGARVRPKYYILLAISFLFLFIYSFCRFNSFDSFPFKLLLFLFIRNLNYFL